MDQVHVIRHKVLIEGRKVRAVARELGVSRNTVRHRILHHLRTTALTLIKLQRHLYRALQDGLQQAKMVLKRNSLALQLHPTRDAINAS